MKRTILLLMVGAAAIFTLSSCLQNEEPAGIENLRNAKSELIKAEAQYKTAEIALVQAQAALQETIKAGQELDNRLKEIDVELAEAELAQVKVIEAYLPKQLSAEELEVRLKEIIARTGATSGKDMGKVMGVASKELAGLAEGRAISAKVKELLG